MKKALITGITGQDGAYLARLLLGLGYRVFGTYRRTSHLSFWRIEELGIKDHENLTLECLDIMDIGNCIRILQKYEPDEIYNLAAMSYVGISFEQPAATLDITGKGALNLLEAICVVNKNIRFYQASTSEMFGLVQEIPQRETTPFYPRSPYAAAKLYAHWMTVNYREAYGIFASSGILFNHESPLRGLEFVTRKITDSAAAIRAGRRSELLLGNLNAVRDWGYADEYVKGMHLMLQHDKADTFILATGTKMTVRDFASLSFRHAGIEIHWKGEGQNEQGIDAETGKTVIRIDKSNFRPSEVELLIGDPIKAEKDLGWKADTDVEKLCRIMVEADMKRYGLEI